MAVAVLSPTEQFFDNSGNPLNGGAVTVYDAGTTTSRAIYTDTALSVAATNPIPLDSAGRPSQGMIYTAATAYKLVVKNSGGTTLLTRDNIDPGVPIGAGALAIANGGTGATSAASALSNLGAATASELADIANEVATLSGAATSTEKTHIATGTTGQRPDSPADGDIRYNTTNGKFEGYDSGWANFLLSNDIADQSTMEAASSTAAVVSPGNMKHHPGAAKAWGHVTYSGSTPTLQAGHNIASITDEGTGDITFTFTTSMSSANYVPIAISRHSSNAKFVTVRAQAAGSVRLAIFDPDGAGSDPEAVSMVVFGDF